MSNEQQRHDISDEVWRLLESRLPRQQGQWGGIAQDNRRFINGVFWILRTGAPWRNLPFCYGNWGWFINTFADGEINIFRKNCLRYWRMNQILSSL